MLLALAQHLDRAEQLFQHHLRCLGSRQPRQYAGIGKGLNKVVNIVRARDAKAGKDIDQPLRQIQHFAKAAQKRLDLSRAGVGV